MAGKEKSKLRQMIDEYGIKDMKDVREFVKTLTAETIQAALDAELENDLGYSKKGASEVRIEKVRNLGAPLFQAFFSTFVPKRAFSFCIKISMNIEPLFRIVAKFVDLFCLRLKHQVMA